MTTYPEELLLRIRAQIEGKENLTGFTTQLGEVTQQVNGLETAIGRLLNPHAPLRLTLDDAPLRGQIQQLKAQLAGMTIRVNFAGGSTSDVRRLTTAVTELSDQLGGLVDKQSVVVREVERVDSGTRKAAIGINNLVAGYQRGAIEGGKFARNAEILGKTMLTVAEEEGIFSRETAVAEAALKKLNTANLSQLRMNAQRELAAVTQAVREANTVRLDWQNGKVSDSATLERVAMMRRGYEQTQQAILGQKEALQGLGVLDEQQTKRVQVLTQQYERYGQALRTLGSIEASIQGTVQKGSLGDSMARGITASAGQATEALRLLQAQEQAGIITKRELASALNAEVTSLRASITATQAKAATLRGLGALDVQQTAELNALTAAELRYTEALARTTAAQTAAARSSSLLRQGMGAAGGRGMGLNNAAMAASFVSPELGMVGMAASMGPAVAGVAGVALAVKGVVDLTVKGQDEAKKWQQAFLVMSANGVKNLDQVAASINDITVNGSRAEKMFSRAELAGAMAELARGGVKGSEALKTLAVSAQLAAAEHIPLNEATERLYANLQHLDMGGDQAASFGDKLARASHMSLASMDNLSKGLNVVGQTAHTLGFSVDETLAMLVSLAKKGMDPATVGATGLRNAMQTIIKPGKEAQAIYAELGVKLKDANGHARSGRDIYMDLRDVFSSSGPIYRQAGANMGTLITQTDLAAMGFKILGTRSATAFLSTRGNIQELTDEVRNSQGFLTNYAETVVGGLEGSQKRLDAATKNLSLSFAKTFTPALASAAELLTEFVNAIDPAVQKLSKLLDLVNSAKTTKEMALAFKITPADSESEAAFKFFAGGVWGTGKAISAVASVSNPFKLPAQARSVELQEELISLDVLKTKPTAAETYKERDYIAAHIPEFEAMLNKALAKHKVIIPKNGVNLPSGPISQPLVGAGPLLPGQRRASDTAQREGAISADVFIKSMTSNVVGDSRINAWCADVVSKMLSRLGYEVKSDVNARQLERNVKAAGGQVIPLSQARQGDVVFYHGIDPYTGRPYGASSGTHVEMGAGWKNGVYQLVGSNTSAHMTGKAIYDTRQATIYRLPGGSLFADNGPAHDTAAPATTASNRPDPKAQAVTVKQLAAELTHLKAQYDANKIGLEQYHAAADKVRTQALALQGTLKEGSKDWSAADRLIIAATSATKTHTKAAQESALTYAQWNKNRAEATRLAQLESDLNDGKLGDKARIEARQTLEKYRNDPVQAAALTEAESRLSDQQKRQEEARRKADQAQQDSQHAAQEAAQHAQQQAQLTKTLNQQLASGQLENAQATVSQMQQTLETRLSALKDDAAARLQVEKSLGQQVLAAQKRVLEQQRSQAIQAAHDSAAAQRTELAKQYGKGKEPAALLRQIAATEKSQVGAAEKTFDAASSRAYLELQERINNAQAKVNDGVEKQSQKVRDLRDKYSSLADDLRQKIEDGSVTQKDIETVSRKLADLDKDSQTAELASNRFIQSAHSGVAAVLEAAKGSAQALSDNKDAEELLKSRAESLQGVLDSVDKLFNSGDTLEAQAQSRSQALGQLSDALSTLGGMQLSSQTLGGFESLSELYDHLTKSGADLSHMDLTGIEQLFQTFQGLSSRNADFLPLEQAKALYEELVKAGLAAKDAMDALDGSKYSGKQRGELLGGYQALGDPEHKRSTLAAIQQQLAGENLADSPLLLDLQKKLEAELAQMDKAIAGRRKEAQAKIDEIKRQQPMTDLEARKDSLGPVGYQRQHEQLATKMENEAWARQKKELADREATDVEIQEAQLEHEGRLTAIARQGAQERFDLQQQAAQRTLSARRAADDAVVRLAQTELERQHNMGLISEGDYLKKRYAMQVQAAQQANTRAVQDASKTVLDPTTGKTHTVVDQNAVKQAQAALTQATKEATNERDAAIAALALRNKRALEDAITAQETASLETRHSKGLLSETEYQSQQEAAERAAAARRHVRAIADAHGDAGAIKAAGIQLQTDLTTITTKGVADRAALAVSERQFRVDQAKRVVDQSNGLVGHAEYRAALEAERQFWVQKIAEAEKGSEAWRKAVQGQQQAADAILQDRQSQIDQYASFAHEGLSLIVDGWDAIASNQDEVDDGMKRIGFQSKDLAKAWGEDMARMVDDVADLTKNIMQGLATGNWAGAIVSGLKIVWNWFTRNSKAAAQAKEDWKNYADQFKIIDPSSFAKQTKTTTGILFWKSDHYTIEINKMAEQVALALEKGVTEGSQAGLKQAIDTNDMSAFESQVKQATYNALLDGMISAFMGSEVVKNTLGKAMSAYATNPNDPAAKANLNKAIQDYKVVAAGFVESTRAALADLAPTAGDLLAASLRTAIASGVESGAKSGILKAVQSGFSNELAQDIRTAVGSSLMDTLTDTFLKSAQMKAIIEPAMSAVVSALADDDSSNDEAAFARFDKQLSVYTDKAGAFASHLHTTMGNAGLLGPGATSSTITNQYGAADTALLSHLQSSDPAERQRALEAYRQQVGGGALSSAYTIASGGTLNSDTDFGSVVSALQSWSQTAAQIAQSGRDHLQAAQLQLQAANINMQAAGQRHAAQVEQTRMSFPGLLLK